MSDTDLTPEEWLAHFGVRGMKWGVRKKYNERQTKKIDSLKRVADGKGTARDKLKALSGSSAAELVANKGLKNTAKKHAEVRQAHLDRINKGEAKTSDLVRMYGSMSTVDLINAGRNKNRSFRPA
jgi:UDP-N-acetylenolpyruvoylglucosamine reductase